MRKVLIISYYWPPSGGISVLRILKFVKYLRNFGWEPVVCVPEGANYMYEDHNNFKDIPEGIEILKTKIIEPFRLFKWVSGRKKDDTNNPFYGSKKKSLIDDFAIWVRGNFFIPDARCLWIAPTVKYLSQYLEQNHVDAILTDGPPHTNTMIGQKLSARYHIPWLADFQDPWTQVDYYKLLKISKWADRKHKRMEQLVFHTASKITIASPTWAKDLVSIGAKNVGVIYYGYDEDDFNDLKETRGDNFILTHTGILSEDRKTETLFRVLDNLCRSDQTFNNKLRIKLAGPVDESIRQCIREYHLENHYSELGNIPRKEALELSLSSNILLLPINKADNAKGRIPGKLYEYLRAQNPILCFGPKDGDVAGIIRETHAGETFSYDDYEGIKSFILEKYHNFEKNRFTDISKYTNENQTKQIAKYLDEISESQG